jgi:flagellar basal-body rod modification protein FlgD
MDIAALGGISSIADEASQGKTLDKQAFLNLLLKQLSLQDPLNPMDSTEFTAQLSQFSSLEELSNINSTLTDVLAYQQSMQNASVAGFIGKDVTAEGNTTYLQDRAEIQYELADDTAAVNITVIDKTGKLVLSENIGGQNGGEQKYIWDGEDLHGNALPDGVYRFEVEAFDNSGNRVDVATATSGVVAGVTFKDNVTYLELEGGTLLSLSQIKSIR